MPEGNKYDGLDGRAIIKKAREEIARLGSEMSLMAGYDQYPAEHRQRVRQERTTAARKERSDAVAAIGAWADRTDADARKLLASDDVGTPAEESRRVANELRVARLVDASRSRGSVREDAQDLAARADRAYSLGNLDEADVLAAAARELHPVRLADEVRSLVAYDRTMADPAKARAMHELDDVEVVIAAFHRDVSAAYSGALQGAVSLAQASGEHRATTELMPEMASASIDAKMAAAVGVQKFGGEYREPDGAIPGLPQSFSRPGHVPQPDGARLPEPRS